MNRSLLAAIAATVLSATSASAGVFNTGDIYNLTDTSRDGRGWIQDAGDNLSLAFDPNGTISVTSDLYDITYTGITGIGTSNVTAQEGSGVNRLTGEAVTVRSKNDLYTLNLVSDGDLGLRLKTWLSVGDFDAAGLYSGTTRTSTAIPCTPTGPAVDGILSCGPSASGGGSVPAPGGLPLVIAASLILAMRRRKALAD